MPPPTTTTTAVTANATLTSGALVRASNTLDLAMPPAAAPVLLSAAPASLTKGGAVAVAPSTGACPTYFWVFAPLGGGPQVNATTAGLTITTVAGALAPGRIYEAKVACMLSGRAAAGPARSLRQAKLGPFSNAVRFTMPVAGAPFVKAEARGSASATVAVQGPPGFSSRFELTLCVLTASCTTVPCTTPQACQLTGLNPGTLYSVTALAFNAGDAPSAVSNTATFVTCPASQPTLCGSTCIAAGTCCKTEPSVGTRCSAPLACPSDGAACGEWIVGGLSSRPSWRGMRLAATCRAGGSCLFASATCEAGLLPWCAGCPTAGHVKCGSKCVDASKCCKTDASVGLRCAAPLTCPSDGSTCGECAAGLAHREALPGLTPCGRSKLSLWLGLMAGWAGLHLSESY